MLSFVLDSQEIMCLARLFCAARLPRDNGSHISSWPSPEYAFYAFSDFKNATFYVCFEIMCQKVAENPEKKFRPRSMEMSSHTSLSDHCNSVPSSPTMIHSEPDSEEQWRWTIAIKQPYIGLSPKKRPSRFIINKQLAFETKNLAELWR